jgi:hypothetical protein
MLRSRLVHTFVVVALLAAPLFLFSPRALVNVYAIGNPDVVGNPNETPWTFVVRVFDPRSSRSRSWSLRPE